MHYYLIDYENIRIKPEEICKLAYLEKKDEIIIFYSPQCKKIEKNIVKTMEESLDVSVTYNKVECGSKNALDFQLATYLGYVISVKNKKNTTYYIVSNDKGYDCLCGYWNGRNKSVLRLDEESYLVNASKKKNKKNKKNNKEATLQEIKDALPKNLNVSTKEIRDIFNSCSKKIEINNKLAKMLKDNKKASAIYRRLKPLMTVKQKA